MIPFDAHAPLVAVAGIVRGPAGAAVIRLVVDTGASQSAIRPNVLAAVGLDDQHRVGELRFFTATGTQTAPIVAVDRLSALDAQEDRFPVASVQFPPEAPFDGLLGLDFFRGKRLCVDFREGQLELA